MTLTSSPSVVPLMLPCFAVKLHGRTHSDCPAPWVHELPAPLGWQERPQDPQGVGAAQGRPGIGAG